MRCPKQATTGGKSANYTYDARGNITAISDGTNTTSYVYDSLDQLTRENNQAAGKTWVYTYDNGGNILSKSEYAYTTGALGTALDTISYGYGDSSWKDLLTSYDGQALTTDAIGNLTNDGTWSYTWQHGRQLAQMSRPDASGDTEMIRFRYDSSGHRIGKDSGVYHASYSGGEIVYAGETTRTSYSYLGDTLTQVRIVEPNSSATLHFTYDEIGPMSVTYDGVEYFYLKNAQGDVTGLVNSSGTQVVAYTYDAWGNPLTTTGTMADTLGKLNPFRYRGYVYDTETGLYYLGSRYYNPQWGRFVNADDLDVLDSSYCHALENDLFAYCFNNPINMTDDNGFWPKLSMNIVKVGIGAFAIGVGVLATIATGGAAIPVLMASLKVAVTSAAIGAAVGAGTNAINHRISTGSWNGVEKSALRGAIDGAADGFMVGGISAGITFTTIASKGIKVQQIGQLKPSNKSGKGYHGVQYKNSRGSLKSFELHSPHKSGPHQRWHWQQNTWNPKNNSITGRSTHWTLLGKRF